MTNENKFFESFKYELAYNDMGLYPASVLGGPNAYEKRSDWQEGWNAYGSQLLDKVIQIGKFIEGIPEQHRGIVKKLLIDDKLSLSVGKNDGDHQLWVNCNDLFFWACSDGEDISIEELPDLLRALEESPKNGDILWVCRKRHTRPQGAYYKYLKGEEHLFDATGPERTDPDGKKTGDSA